MANTKQAIIQRLMTERSDEFPGSNLELYLEVQDILNTIKSTKYTHITESQQKLILNKWVQKRYCPVDTSLKSFR